MTTPPKKVRIVRRKEQDEPTPATENNPAPDGTWLDTPCNHRLTVGGYVSLNCCLRSLPVGSSIGWRSHQYERLPSNHWYVTNGDSAGAIIPDVHLEAVALGNQVVLLALPDSPVTVSNVAGQTALCTDCGHEQRFHHTITTPTGWTVSLCSRGLTLSSVSAARKNLTVCSCANLTKRQ